MEWFVTDDGEYRIESLSRGTFPGALAVIKESFYRDESVSIGCEIIKNPKAGDELLELCADAALDGVSLVAVAVSTGEVAAVSFNKIQTKPSSASERPFFEEFAAERCSQAASRALVEFMFDVDARCNFFEKLDVDCSLEIMFLATLQQHRGKRLGTLLCKYSVELARKVRDGPVGPVGVEDLGPTYSHLKPHGAMETYPKICQAIWTVGSSQKIGKALNFTVYLTVPFSEFVYDGKTYSERIGDEDAFCEIAALKLY